MILEHGANFGVSNDIGPSGPSDPLSIILAECHWEALSLEGE